MTLLKEQPTNTAYPMSVYKSFPGSSLTEKNRFLQKGKQKRNAILFSLEMSCKYILLTLELANQRVWKQLLSDLTIVCQTRLLH